jgi:hypothetical protein
MRLKELIGRLYGVKKDGAIKHFGLNFVSKNGLDLEKEYTTKESALSEVVLLLTDLKKRQTALSIINELIVETVRDVGVNLSDVRNKTYKQVAKACHPDSSTGDTESFKVLQEIKEFFWDYKGEPRKEICRVSWASEKEIASPTYNRFDKYKK